MLRMSSCSLDTLDTPEYTIMILLSFGKILRIFTTIKNNSKSPFRIITSRIVINTVHGMVEHDSSLYWLISCTFGAWGVGRLGRGSFGAWVVWGVGCLGRGLFGAFAKLSNWGVIQLRRLNLSSNPS